MLRPIKGHRPQSLTLPLLLIAALFLSSCAGSSPAVEAVDFVVAPTETRPAEVPTPIAAAAVLPPTAEPCVVERITDEYGFEVEVSSCASGTSASEPTSFISLDAYLGSESARVLLRGVRDRLVLQSGCAGGFIEDVDLVPGPAVRDAALAIPDADFATGVNNLFAALSAVDDTCDDAAAWIQAMRLTFNEMQALEETITETPGELLVSREGELDDLTLVTADAIAHYDRLYFALTGFEAIQGSDLWYSSHQLMNVRGLREMMATGQEPTAILMGNSILARAIDPIAMSDELDTTVINAALGRSTTPIQARFLDQLLTIAPTPKTLIWSEVSTRFFRPSCTTLDVLEIADPIVRQDNLFVGVDELIDAAPLDRLFGSDPTNPTYAATPILADGEEAFGQWDRGYWEPLDREFDPEANEDRPDRPGADPTVCELQIDDIIKSIERWVGQGHTVLYVAGPVSDFEADSHPQGREAHNAVDERLRAAVELAGGSFADLSELLEHEEFADAGHPNEAGRSVVTAAIMDLLEQ